LVKKYAVAILLTSSLIAFGVARSQTSAAKVSGAAAELKQMEQDWADSYKANDAGKLGRIVADDWRAIGPDGSVSTKAEEIAGLKSGRSKVESIEFGPIDVKVIGHVGIVQGSNDRKSSRDGKDTGGKFAWTDVFVKRDGKWVAVRSQVARVK
jgi:ketosteroid isomerase-like protein